MASNAAQISCPNCGAPIQARIQQLLDVGRDPSAKSRLLSGGINRAQCSVCGFDGTIATPLVYHDPAHELLLTFVPVEININKTGQERLIGQLINRVINELPAEDRKGYLLQPQAVLTMQGLIDRVLESEGISKEELEAQQSKMRLFEDLLRVPQEQLAAFVKKHDSELDATFFQLISLTLQATADPRAQEAMSSRLQVLLEQSTFGKRLQAQEAEIKAATDSLRKLSEGTLTRESLLDLFVEAPSEDRVTALTNLTRPALDYEFFQLLSKRIDQSQGDEKTRLGALRGQILEVTEEIDKLQEARSARAASLLKTLVEADDVQSAVEQAIPLIDELFLGTLQANLQAARERGETGLAAKFEQIENLIQDQIAASLPPGIRLAQDLLGLDSEDERLAMLQARAGEIDDNLLGSLMQTSQRLSETGDEEAAAEIHGLYKAALKMKMKGKRKSQGG
jgi:hypothetical protein